MKCKRSHQTASQNYLQRKPKTCNDALCICVFLIFWCFLIIIIVFSITYGNYNVAIKGADSFGNICNQTKNKHFENFKLSAADTSNKPFLLFFDSTNLVNVVKICIEECPEFSISSIFSMFRYSERTSAQICLYDFNILRAANTRDEEPLIGKTGPCPIINSKRIPYRNRCVNTGPNHIVKESYDILNSGGLDQSFFIAVYLTWYYVAGLCGFAFVISLIILAMMFFLTKIIAWIIWFLVIVTNALLCTVLLLNYNNVDIEENKEEEMFSLDGQYMNNGIAYDFLDEHRANKIVILCSAGWAVCIAISLVILTFIWFKHLKQLKLLFEEARACIKCLPGLCIAPIIAQLFIILLISLSGYTLFCLTTASSATVETFPTDLKSKIQLHELSVSQEIKYSDSKSIRRTFWIYIVGLLWTTEFIFAFAEFCIGTTVALWYFRFSFPSPSTHAIGVLIKYHLGTITKGAALITLLKIPRLMLTFIIKCLKKRANQLWFDRLQFVEQCFGIFNHNAYSPAALERIAFCPAAVIAWKIFNKNTSQVESINNVFDFVMFLSKLSVATLTGLVGVILLKGEKNNLLFFMAPVLFSTFCAFCIAHIVFSIVEMTVDTLLLCICEDQHVHGGLKRLSVKFNLTKLLGNNGEGTVQVITIKTIHGKPLRGIGLGNKDG